MREEKTGFIKERVAAILAGMKHGTYEREEVLALSLLSALAGESIFLLGLPGVGKSMVARRLKLAFTDATVFEYLMSRFSTPDEIFGPVSISKLKDEDCYERVTAGFLPEAEVVFLDEIWKAGPAIQNSLLTVLNEKIYLNGNRELHLPMKGIIAASNELPADGEGLEALWDRFIMRYIVDPIERKENFKRLLCPEEKTIVHVDNPITHDEYLAIGQAASTIAIPEKVLDCIVTLRDKLNKKMKQKYLDSDDSDDNDSKFYISDRRWKKAVAVMRTAAYLNGRRELDFSDVMLLNHMLWNEDGVIDEIQRAIAETILEVLFKDILEKFKSSKRHALNTAQDQRLFTPDNIHYVIQCDGSPLKIKKHDYETICASPDEIFFGSESSDSTMVLRQRGQFAIRFVKEGYIGINGYTYALRTTSDEQFSRNFIVKEIGSTIDSIENQLYRDLNNNIFTANIKMQRVLQPVIEIYKQRITTM